MLFYLVKSLGLGDSDVLVDMNFLKSVSLKELDTYYKDKEKV